MANTRHFDCVVVGCGGVGSAVLYQLAQRGRRVLGIDRYGSAHDRGSSHGQTRAIRMAYFEHPNYVPLLRRAYELWRELEKVSGTNLFDEVGLVEIGPPDGEVIPGVLAAAEQFQLPVERWTRDQLSQRCPLFQVPDGLDIVYEQNAGFLRVEACVTAHLDMASRLGAELWAPCQVQQIDRDAQPLRIVTDRGDVTCERVIVCGGPWTSTLLSHLKLPLRVLRKPMHWFPTDDPRYLVPQGCPVFFFEVDQSFFYGFPQLDSRGVKIAQHHGGVELDDPSHVSSEIDEEEREQVTRFAQRYLRGLGRPEGHAVCMYTMTPDGHFIVDRDPSDERFVFACGLSGHGFKFTTVLGEILADAATTGSIPQSAHFLGLRDDSH